MNAASPAPAELFLPQCAQKNRTRRPPLKASSVSTYQKALRHYFGTFKGTVPCDAQAIHRYVATMRKSAAATIYLRLQAVRYEHVRRGLPVPTDDPDLRSLMRDLQHGVKPGPKAGAVSKKAEPRQARAITRHMLSTILDAMGNNALDRRDRCLILLSFGAALSRSAVVAIDIADIRFTNDAMLLKVRETVDAERPRSISVPITGHELCAATATRDWIQYAALDLEGGPLLRRFSRAGDPTNERLSGAYVNVIVKSRLKAVGVDPEPYSGLSLRRGRLAEMARGVM